MPPEPTAAQQSPARGYDRVKSVADRCVSVLLLAAASPLLLGVGLAVRRALGSPVLFRQERVGRHGRTFVLVKFRTMVEPRPGEDRLATDADRLHPLGRLLRATSLDELPTLVNVARGELSLVGPRPLLPAYLPLYTAEQARRHDVAPGLTGLAQVRGRNALGWEARLAVDVEYVERRSLLLDLAILGRTVAAVLGRRGISAAGSSTMPAFTGAPGTASVAGAAS